MNASEEEMCDDIIIEVQQSSQMIKIYSELLKKYLNDLITFWIC